MKPRAQTAAARTQNCNRVAARLKGQWQFTVLLRQFPGGVGPGSVERAAAGGGHDSDIMIIRVRVRNGRRPGGPTEPGPAPGPVPLRLVRIRACPSHE